MPIVYVDTSLREGAVAQDFEKRFSEVIARVLNKPMEKIVVILKTNQRICKDGDRSEPTCVIKMHSIGVFGEDKNGGYVKEFLTFLTKELKLESNRISMMFLPLEAHQVSSTYNFP